MSGVAESIITVFLIGFLGRGLGRIRIRGVDLGVSGIFFAGLVFGHFGAELPQVLQSLGLVLFITAVGLSAGEGFFTVLRRSGGPCVLVCAAALAAGALSCVAVMRIFGMDTALAVGILSGAFTNSTGYGAAKAAVSGSAAAVEAMSAGYGVIYPLGLICKVLFVQLVPKFLHADMAEERRRVLLPEAGPSRPAGRIRLDEWGMGVFSLTVVLGVLLGTVPLPLPGGGVRLGLTGGPLLAGLLISRLGRAGPLDLRVKSSSLAPVKELGRLLFFSGAGTEGGRGFADILSVWGAKLLIGGAVMVIVPLLAAFCLAYGVMRMPLFNSLTVVSASVTSTPSLAMLVNMTGVDGLGAVYAAVYPVSLLLTVVVLQVLLRLGTGWA